MHDRRPDRPSIPAEPTTLASDPGASSGDDPKFRGFLEAAPDAVVIVDREGIIQLVNGQTERLFGHPRSVLIGQKVEILVPERFRNVHVGHRSLFFEAPRVRAMGTGQVLYGLRADGTEFPVEISLSPLETDGGTLVASTIRDVTERTRAEARFRDLLEAAPDAMVIVSESGRIELVNAQAVRLFGYAREEMIGRDMDMLVPERYRATHPAHRAQYFESPRPRPMGSGLTLHGRRKDGSEFPVEISLGPLQTTDGVLVSSAIRDVTARKQAEQELLAAKEEAEAASQELEAFSYSVAHDLRAPLRGVDGFSLALLEDYGDHLDDEARRYLHRIRSSAQHMAELIDSLLVLARMTRMEISRQCVDLAALAEVEVERLRSTHPDAAVEVLIAPDLTVSGDPRLLAVLLQNLLGNAWKFSAGRDTPRVVLARASDAAAYALRDGGPLPLDDAPHDAFFIQDNGAGFDMAYADKLFGVFQRLHTTSEFQGTGIGLATVQRIVRRHGGQVSGHGEVGRGATFTFTLPEGTP